MTRQSTDQRNLLFTFVSLVVLLIGIPSVCPGQINRSSLTGVVTDTSGAVIVGAKVALVEDGTQARNESTTDQAGGYSFSALPLGRYTLTVTQSSFKTYVRSGIELNAGDNKRLDLALEVGEMNQQVEVTGTAPVLEASEPIYTDTIATDTLEKLPILLNGLKRDASNYLATLPGIGPVTKHSLARRLGVYALQAERAVGASLDVNGPLELSVGRLELNGTLFGSRLTHAIAARDARTDVPRLELINAPERTSSWGAISSKPAFPPGSGWKPEKSSETSSRDRTPAASITPS